MNDVFTFCIGVKNQLAVSNRRLSKTLYYKPKLVLSFDRRMCTYMYTFILCFLNKLQPSADIVMMLKYETRETERTHRRILR